jgi:hemolysin III
MQQHRHDAPSEVIPVLRGVLHAYAFWVAVVAGAVLVAIAPHRDARIAAVVYAGGMCALFAASGLYHRWRWNPRWRPLLRRIDHSSIYVFIAATTTPVATLGLDGAWRIALLVTVWAGAAAGVALSVAWITAPRVLVAASYVALGWVAIVSLPQMADRLGVAPIVLFAAGGVIYSVGAAVYAFRRPNPWPSTFGFHEIFHALVILAAVTHFVAIAGWVIPSG